MKKTYIIPLTTIETTETEMILVASQFNTNSDTQSITPTDEVYEGEFCVKESGQDWDW